MMAEGELQQLRTCVQQQQSQINSLRDECAAMRDCLEAAGVLSSEQFVAQLQRRRFAAPTVVSSSRSTISDILPMDGLALPIIQSAGFPIVGPLRATSSFARQAVAAVEPSFQNIFPRKVIVVGGFYGMRVLSSATQLNPDARTWDPLPSMNKQRHGTAATAAQGVLYVLGGLDGLQNLRSGERLHVFSGQWEDLPHMQVRRGWAAAAYVSDCVYVVGGYDGENDLRSAERLHNPTSSSSASWEALSVMHTARRAPAASALGGKIYVLGGCDRGNTLNSGECYDPSTGAWQMLPPMIHKRRIAAAATVAGKVYVVGGLDGAQCLNSAERFNPKSWSWEALPDMHFRRGGASAAALNGQLYVIGGLDGAQDLASVERFDPQAGIWEAIEPLEAPRRNAAAATVPI